jgi:hypothetical protein
LLLKLISVFLSARLSPKRIVSSHGF